MNVSYVLYDNTGKITASGSCPEIMVEAQNVIPGVTVLQGEGRPETQYVDTLQDPPEIKERLPFPGVQNKNTILADGTDEWIVSDLPVGSIVTVNDIVTVVNDGSFEFSVDLPGTYTFKFDPFPYLEEEVSIEVIT